MQGSLYASLTVLVFIFGFCKSCFFSNLLPLPTVPFLDATLPALSPPPDQAHPLCSSSLLPQASGPRGPQSSGRQSGVYCNGSAEGVISFEEHNTCGPQVQGRNSELLSKLHLWGIVSLFFLSKIRT